MTIYSTQPTKCPRCFEDFFPEHPRAVYCHSEECTKLKHKEHYARQTRTLTREHKYPQLNCKICNKEYRPRSLSNKGVCGDMYCQKEQRKLYNRNNKSKGIKHHRQYYIKKYGLTLDMFNAMLEAQNHSCKICNKHMSENNKDKNGIVKHLSIDHNHETGQVRGLLCNRCNTALGSFNDNIESLTNAIRYLNESKDSEILIPDYANFKS